MQKLEITEQAHYILETVIRLVPSINTSRCQNASKPKLETDANILILPFLALQSLIPCLSRSYILCKPLTSPAKLRYSSKRNLLSHNQRFKEAN